jgi:hypothetical protein
LPIITRKDGLDAKRCGLSRSMPKSSGLYAIIIPMGWLLIRVASKVGALMS